MRNYTFLLFSIALLLSGCDEKQDDLAELDALVQLDEEEDRPLVVQESVDPAAKENHPFPQERMLLEGQDRR